MEADLKNKPPTEWTVKYWQWIYSKPKEDNPLKTGNIQQDEFLSLPCTGGGEDCSRLLTLSGTDAKKDILIPVFASEYCTAETLGGTDEELRVKARSMSTPIHMEISLNGKSLIPYYIETDPFEITVPSNHTLENDKAPPGTYRAISCGYWHRLSPLPKGKHKVVFGGCCANGFSTKVVYEINIS